MSLSGLNKALHSLHCKNQSSSNQLEIVPDVIANVNIILRKISSRSHLNAIAFKEVTENVLQSLSPRRYEVYATLKGLEGMVEVVDAIEEGFSSLELTSHAVRYDWPWYGCLDDDRFLQPRAVHQHLKKLGQDAIEELHSKQLLRNVCITEEDMKSSRFRFELTTKCLGNVVVYVVPAVEFEMHPQCLRAGIPFTFKSRKVLVAANGPCNSSRDKNHQILWQISLLTFENEVFGLMDVDGGVRWIVREVLHLLCEKYVHYPTSRKIVDTLLMWNLCAHLQKEDWVPEKLALRVLELLENLRRALRNHRVRSFFTPSYNLLGEFDGLKLDKGAERLQYLILKLQENPHCLQLFNS